MTDGWIGRAVSVATSRARDDTPVHVKSRRWCVRPRPRDDETATARRRRVGWKNRGERTADDGRRGRGIKLAAWIRREPHHHHHHHHRRRWGESPTTTTRDDARRRFVSVTTRRRNRTMRVIFSPPAVGEGREDDRAVARASRPSFDDETNHPSSPGVSRVMMTRSVRDRSVRDRSIDRRSIDRGVEDASSRRRVGFGWVIFLFVRFLPVSSSDDDDDDGGRRGRRTRAPTRGSGRVGFARAHTSALRQPLVVVVVVDFFLLDFQSTLIPFDES